MTIIVFVSDCPLSVCYYCRSCLLLLFSVGKITTPHLRPVKKQPFFLARTSKVTKRKQMTQAARAERCKRRLFTIENGDENCCDNSQLTVLEQHELRKRIPQDAEKLVSWKLPNNKDENKTPEKIFSEQSLREFYLFFLSFFFCNRSSIQEMAKKTVKSLWSCPDTELLTLGLFNNL